MSRGSVTIGVLGGMGPEACAVFHRQLIRENPATADQDHFRILVLDDPHIPDRTSFLQGVGEDPRPALCARARELETFGAGLIAIPCNTAHVFWDDIQRAVSIPVLHIVEATIDSLPESDQAIAVLATEGTMAAGLYQDGLQQAGLKAWSPDEALQQRISAVIEGVKKGRDPESLASELADCCTIAAAGGAGAAILGCTELGMLTSGRPSLLPLHDSALALARATLARARAMEAGSIALSG